MCNFMENLKDQYCIRKASWYTQEELGHNCDIEHSISLFPSEVYGPFTIILWTIILQGAGSGLADCTTHCKG